MLLLLPSEEREKKADDWDVMMLSYKKKSLSLSFPLYIIKKEEGEIENWVFFFLLLLLKERGGGLHLFVCAISAVVVDARHIPCEDLSRRTVLYLQYVHVSIQLILGGGGTSPQLAASPHIIKTLLSILLIYLIPSISHVIRSPPSLYHPNHIKYREKRKEI